jgi:hypothetical protein
MNSFNVERRYSLSEINEALVPSSIVGVMNFTSIKVLASEWEEYLEEINKACALAWIKKHNNTLPYPITPEVIQAAQGTRQRFLFRETRLNKLSLREVNYHDVHNRMKKVLYIYIYNAKQSTYTIPV